MIFSFNYLNFCVSESCFEGKLCPAQSYHLCISWNEAGWINIKVL